jgi:hypothetical protein
MSAQHDSDDDVLTDEETGSEVDDDGETIDDSDESVDDEDDDGDEEEDDGSEEEGSEEPSDDEEMLPAPPVPKKKTVQMSLTQAVQKGMATRDARQAAAGKKKKPQNESGHAVVPRRKMLSTQWGTLYVPEKDIRIQQNKRSSKVIWPGGHMDSRTCQVMDVPTETWKK